MDRKAWIVVTLCVIAMGVNFWWGTRNQPSPAPAPTTPAPTAAPGQQPGTAASPTPGTTPGTPAPTPAPAPAPAPVPVEEKKVVLKNDKAEYTFTTKGGGIAEAVLLDTKDRVKLNTQGKAAIGSLTSAAKTYEDLLPYRIVEQTDSRVIFEAESPEKVLVRKAYSFTTGEGSSGHLLKFELTLTNNSGAKLTRDNYFLYAGAANELRPDEVSSHPAFTWNNGGDPTSKDTNAFRDGPNWLGFGGPIVEYQESLAKMRWAGVMSRFYTTLFSNKEDQASRIWVQRFLVDVSKSEFKDHPKAHEFRAIHGGFSLAPVELEPGASKVHEFNLYLGPKIYHDLKKIDKAGEGLNDRELRGVMFYGKWFGWISIGLATALRAFHDWTGNWGVAIILLTIAVRSLLWPLQARSNAQMKRMGKLSPMIKELQEKYKDDQQRFAQEQMKLFREYGVNPLGGCLPLLIQFPIFIAFFSVLQVATELRGQPFILWVQDLSLPDTIFTRPLPFTIPFTNIRHFDLNPLPLLMGLTMFLQMKLTPQPSTVDPMQRRIFMLMPFMFLAFCYGFASALALYWTFTNVFMIVQAQITRLWKKEDDAPLKKINPGGGGGGSGTGGGGWMAPKGPAPQNPYAPGGKKKKDKGYQPRPGGGGAKSTRPKS